MSGVLVLHGTRRARPREWMPHQDQPCLHLPHLYPCRRRTERHNTGIAHRQRETLLTTTMDAQRYGVLTFVTPMFQPCKLAASRGNIPPLGWALYGGVASSSRFHALRRFHATGITQSASHDRIGRIDMLLTCSCDWDSRHPHDSRRMVHRRTASSTPSI